MFERERQTRRARGANIFLWAQRAPHLAKRSGVLPTLQSNGTNITAATSGWNLTAASGAWVGPALTISRLWYRDGSSLGATASTFALGAADSGHAISCKVVVSNKYASGYAVATLGTTQFR